MRPADRGRQIGQERVARLLADLSCHRERPGEPLSAGNNFPHQADLVRPLGRDPLSGDDQRQGRAPAQKPRQVDGPAVDERHPPTAAGDGKGRLRLGQADVSVAEEFEAPRVRVALRDGDHRLHLHDPRPAHRAAGLRFGGETRQLLEAGQIGPRTKRRFARPVQDGHGERVIVAKAEPRLAEQAGRRTVDRVVHLGAMDFDFEDAATLDGVRRDDHRRQVGKRAGHISVLGEIIECRAIGWSQ